MHRLIISLFSCILSVILSAYLVGLSSEEKNILKRIIKNYKIKLLGNAAMNE